MYLPKTVVLRTVVTDRSISCTPKGALQVGPCIEGRRTARSPRSLSTKWHRHFRGDDQSTLSAQAIGLGDSPLREV